MQGETPKQETATVVRKNPACMHVCMPTLHRTKNVYMHSCIIDSAAVSSTEASDGGAHQTLSAASKPHVELRLEERDGSTFCDVVMSL